MLHLAAIAGPGAGSGARGMGVAERGLREEWWQETGASLQRGRPGVKLLVGGEWERGMGQVTRDGVGLAEVAASRKCFLGGKDVGAVVELDPGSEGV
jgi:hypothetical protein